MNNHIKFNKFRVSKSSIDKHMVNRVLSGFVERYNEGAYDNIKKSKSLLRTINNLIFLNSWGEDIKEQYQINDDFRELLENTALKTFGFKKVYLK